jgi:hypothetical protein
VTTNKLSSYLTIATVLDTGLNTLAATTGKAISGALDNTTDLAIWADLELVVTFGSNPTAGQVVEVYLVPSVDGTNYADGDASIAPPYPSLVAAFPVRAVTTAQRIAFRGVQLPPGLYKYQVSNKTGQAFAASGNTLKERRYGTQAV